MRYLRGNVNYCLLYIRDGENDIEGYSDAHWAGDVNDRKSTSINTYLQLVEQLLVGSEKKMSVPCPVQS